MGRQLSGELERLLENACKGTEESMSAQLLPQEAQPAQDEASGKWKGIAAAGAILPGAACVLSLLLKASPLVTGAVTLICCGGELLALHRLEARRKRPQPAPLPVPVISVNAEQRRQAMERSLEELERILNYVDQREAERDKGYDITMDRRFGEWVQAFLTRTRGCDDRTMARLRDGLLDRLADMKIHVYDELILDESGRPEVPFADYLIDAREDESYHELVQPAVYSDRALLARGKLR